MGRGPKGTMLLAHVQGVGALCGRIPVLGVRTGLCSLGNAWSGRNSAEQSEPFMHSQGAWTDRVCLYWLSALYHTKMRYFTLKLNILSC